VTDGRKVETQRPSDSRQKTDPRQKRGRLTVFFGMAPGVGKTFAMLQAARGERLAGRDVLIGFIETHGAAATRSLTKGLTRIPGLPIYSGDSTTSELNVDAIRVRQPHLVLVDELAHANAPGSRHPRRYLDVYELLEAGIDVYTTLNLQNVASESDAVERITGLASRHQVPDTVLDGAEIRLVDLPPASFRKRLREQMAYLTQDPELSRSDFFSESNLMTLRQLAWRFAADRVGRGVHQYMQTREIHGPGRSGDHLLAVINDTAIAEQIVRRARRLADALNAPWIVLYVEAPRAQGETERAQIDRALALAEELGAEVIATTDDDPVGAVLRVASQRNVTQIILGKSPGPRWRFFERDRMLSRLVREGGNMEIHVVRAGQDDRRKPFRRWRIRDSSTWVQYAIAIGVVLAITLIVYLVGPRAGGPHAAALIYLLAVVVLGSSVRRGPTLVAATMSALLWDYFILSPVYAFRITNVEDALFFVLYFTVALILGHLTARNHAQQSAERLREERATALYLLSRELNEVTGLDQILQHAVRQMQRAFKAQIVVLLRDPPDQLGDLPHPASTFEPTAEERRAGGWAFLQGQRAGRFTANFPQAEALFVPLTTSEGRMGVIGLRLSQSSAPTIHQLNLLDAFSQQIAFALDRHYVRGVAERAKLLAESERLSKTLLNSMSHEMRTPIAVIKSAVSNLAQLQDPDLAEPQSAIIAAIQDATGRLNRLVGNVLEITRLESGHVKPRFSECDVRDLVHLAIDETETELAHHQVTVDIAPYLPMVPMDFVLMEQALANLLSNAAVHTAPGTQVLLSARMENNLLVLEVADRGPGIRPESLGRIFEKFYREPSAPTGGTGLGLSLVKGFVEAQRGHVAAQNRAGGGAVFTIHLPLGNIAAVSVEADL
jgi:two-component system sensor histidine kinase KdpD